jgi:hypothetical protein
MGDSMHIGSVSIALVRDRVKANSDTKPAICDELWALHCSGVDEDEALFKITHRPTGYLLIEATWDLSLAIWQELQRRSDVDWAFTDPKAAIPLKAAWEEIHSTARKAVRA